MARSKTPKRFYAPDIRYSSVQVTRLMNYIMCDGKKSTAMSILYKAFDIIQEKEGDPLEVLAKAVEYIKPQIEVRSKRVGGANLQIPTQVRPARQEQLWMRWLIQAAQNRSEKTMAEKFAYEVIAASKGEGNAVKRRRGSDKAADSHKAYSHLK